MTKSKSLLSLLLILLALFIGGCNYSFGFASATPAAPAVIATAAPVEAPVEVETGVTDAVETDAAIVVESTGEPVAAAAAEADQSAGIVVETTGVITATEPYTNSGNLSGELVPTVKEEKVEFTAGLGLATFSAYRLNFSAVFSGTRQGQPAAGSLNGLFEVTRNPEARHWRVELAGDTFSELASFGEVVELYHIGNTIYLQNPQDGAWLGMPAFLVNSLIPPEIYTPEDQISLPATAVPQPGEEIINGVVTRRYTFGPQDIVVEAATYDHIEGTIWVAVEGNYVVRYEATVSGQQQKLAVSGMELLDSGVATMVYEVSDVNGALTISPPAGAAGGFFFR